LQERSEITDLHFDHCSSPRMEGLWLRVRIRQI
jgi:hypothetical protein